MTKNKGLKRLSKLADYTVSVLPVVGRKQEEDSDKYDLRKQISKRFAEDTAHRSGLIRWVKWVVTLWLVLVLGIVTFHGTLSDSIKITLLATTTANILGLAYIVLRGLFADNQK